MATIIPIIGVVIAILVYLLNKNNFGHDRRVSIEERRERTISKIHDMELKLNQQINQIEQLIILIEDSPYLDEEDKINHLNEYNQLIQHQQERISDVLEWQKTLNNVNLSSRTKEHVSLMKYEGKIDRLDKDLKHHDILIANQHNALTELNNLQ